MYLDSKSGLASYEWELCVNQRFAFELEVTHTGGGGQ